MDPTHQIAASCEKIYVKEAVIPTVTQSFYMRNLPSPSIPFSSPKGRSLFKESLDSGYMDVYFPLAEQFVTQSHPAFCGLASLTMALNTLKLDPERVWKGVWRWYDENMLGECCINHEVVEIKGITLKKLACLANCNGVQCEKIYASDSNVEDFRQTVKRVCSQYIESILIVSYNRSKLQQTGTGHFSPIGGYHPDEDMVLIMDVARFKYPPHWVPLSVIFTAMCDIDPDTGRSRGYLILRKQEEEDQSMDNKSSLQPGSTTSPKQPCDGDCDDGDEDDYKGSEFKDNLGYSNRK